MTKIFLDTSNMDQIRRWRHIIEGVTTNPSILKKEGRDLFGICEIMGPNPVSVEAGGDLRCEAKKLWDWLSSETTLAIKIPFLKPNGEDNLQVICDLVRDGLVINCTAIMSLSQVVLATKAGARYVSIFAGRIDDEGGEFSRVVEESQNYIETQGLNTLFRGEEFPSCELIVGSLRSVGMVLDCIRVDADIVTVSPEILFKMTQHARGRETSEQFENDYVPVDSLRGGF